MCIIWNQYNTCCYKFAIIVPPGSVTVSRSPSSGTLYTSDALSLTCVTTLTSSIAVDVPVYVSHQWIGPRGVVINTGNGILVSEVSISGLEHRCNLTIPSLRSSQSGTYTCSSIVGPRWDSENILQSTAQVSAVSIPIGMCACVYVSQSMERKNEELFLHLVVLV